MPRLMILVASTRPGRVGLPIARWLERYVAQNGWDDVDFADLLEIGLPFMDEPNHPRMRQYTHQHTKDWSARVEAADAFAFVMPEYNYSMTAPLKNALDFLNVEWGYKPVGFVSYGGVSAGTRAVQVAKQVVTTLKMYPLAEAISLPFIGSMIDDEGEFQPNEIVEQAAAQMLAELARVSDALAVLRT